MIQPVPETRHPAIAADPTTGRFHLGGHRVIDVDGDDAEAFLQGQFCNDVAALGAGRAQINGYCTPKGRLLATFVLQRRPDGFRLVLPDAMVAEAFVKRLGMFIMRAAVTLRPRTELAVLGLIGGAGSCDGSFDALPDLPDALLGVTDAGEVSLVHWHDDPVMGARALGVVARDTVGDLVEGDALWRLADIRAGLPSVRVGTMEAFVPQMVNFREIEAVSFKKGCYPGQEIVARMHYLGKQKRHMRRFVATGEVDGALVPVPGDALGEAGAGEVVDAVRTRDGVELLAVVRIGTWGDGLALGEGAPTAFDAALPYAPHEPQDAEAGAGS